MMLLEMPDHILTRVFNLLEIKDRLNLTLVCQQLNQLFGNEKALMKNILVNYEDSVEGDKIKYRRFLDSMVSSGRKYRNFNIYLEKNFHVNAVEDFLPLTKFMSLTELNIFLDEIELEDLALLVNNLPNLESLLTGIVELKNTKNSEEKLICRKLKKLDTALEIFLQMMETPDLIDLEICHNIRLPLKDLKLDAFCKKIVTLEKLKYLDIDQPIFNQELTENAKFKLMEVTVDYKDWANTINFLKAQNELQILTVSFIEGVEQRLGQDIILSTLLLPKLKDLEIYELYFTADSRFDQDLFVSANTNIETFSLVQSFFAEEFIIKLIPKLPNLKHLILNVEEGFFDDELVILNTLKHLEKLDICASDCVLPHLNLPKLEDFSLKYPHDDQDLEGVNLDDENLQKFFQIHRNLKKVEIRRLISEDLWKFMKKNLHHLELFKTISSEKRNHFLSDGDFKIEVNSFYTTAKRIRFNN